MRHHRIPCYALTGTHKLASPQLLMYTCFATKLTNLDFSLYSIGVFLWKKKIHVAGVSFLARTRGCIWAQCILGLIKYIYNIGLKSKPK